MSCPLNLTEILRLWSILYIARQEGRATGLAIMATAITVFGQ